MRTERTAWPTVRMAGTTKTAAGSGVINPLIGIKQLARTVSWKPQEAEPVKSSSILLPTDIPKTRTPEQFIQHSLVDGVIAYYQTIQEALKPLESTSKTQGGIHQVPKLGLSVLTDDRLTKLEQARKAFQEVRLDMEIQGIHQLDMPSLATKTLPAGPISQQREAFLEMAISEEGREWLWQTAHRLFRISQSLAPEIPISDVPSSDSQDKGDSSHTTVQAYLDRVKQLSSRTPEWYESRGTAKAILSYYRRLEKVLSLDPIQLMKSSAATATWIPGKGLQTHGVAEKSVVMPQVSLPNLLAASKTFEALQASPLLAPLKDKPVKQQVSYLLNQALKQPHTAKHTATQLFELLDSLTMPKL